MEFNLIRNTQQLMLAYVALEDRLPEVFEGEDIDMERFIDLFRNDSWLYRVEGDRTVLGYFWVFTVAPGVVKFGVIGCNGFNLRRARGFIEKLRARLAGPCFCIIGEVPAHKRKIISLARRLGWTESGWIPNYFGDGADMIILTLKP